MQMGLNEHRVKFPASGKSITAQEGDGGRVRPGANGTKTLRCPGPSRPSQNQLLLNLPIAAHCRLDFQPF